MSIEPTSHVAGAKRQCVLLIDHRSGHVKTVREKVKGTNIDVREVDTVQNAIRQMLIHGFDVIALNTGVVGAVPLCPFLFDLRQAKGTLLIIYPVITSQARAHFLCKGFDMCLSDDEPHECAAAIRALLSRPCAESNAHKCEVGGYIIYKDLSIDPLRRCVKMAGKEVELSPTEYKLLYFMSSNPTVVFSKEYLYERLWGERAYGANSVADFICSLRRKLGLSAKDNDYIQTVSRTGYRFGTSRK